MNCDVSKATEGLENELWRRWSDGKVWEWAELIVIVIAELILQPFRRFTYVTAHSPTLPLLYLRHSSFYNPSVALPTSQFIFQPFRCFTYVTAHSPTLPLLHLRHSSFSNPYFASSKNTFFVAINNFRHSGFIFLELLYSGHKIAITR